MHNNSNNKEQTKIEEDVLKSSGLPFESGVLRHKMNFVSVFDNHDKATTYHNQWVMVDYIFYSGHYNSKRNICEERYLKLLAKHQLPNIKQLKRIGTIPNHTNGSDHMSLSAKFVLFPID